MKPVSLENIAEELAGAGLLAGRYGELPSRIEGVADDTRRLRPGELFVALRGAVRDGHDFLADAAAKGAVAALVEESGRTELPHLVVLDGRRAAALAAAVCHGHPARSLRLLAVTGTNGKTTTVGMLRHLLNDSDGDAASIGTLGVLLGSGIMPMPGGTGLTTPGPIELQGVLRALVDAGVRTVAMEVSSHSLHQRRVEGLRFAAGVFTNLTRDHLDYHGSMDTYLAAKAQLVRSLADDGVAVLNADDPAWTAVSSTSRTIRFSALGRPADVQAEDVVFSPVGSTFTLRLGDFTAPVSLPLIGDFNVSNALGAAATAWGLGSPPREIAERIATLPQVPGRLERLSERPAVLRDYAHTPDALERALLAVRPFVRGRLLCVFGCGGDRDRGKRPEMGSVAARLSDLAFVTSDNPRTEDPERILDEIEAGMDGVPHRRIEDRREAIAQALESADPADDLVLLAGKGHETYQIRGTVSLPFDEKIIVQELLASARRA